MDNESPVSFKARDPFHSVELLPRETQRQISTNLRDMLANDFVGARDALPGSKNALEANLRRLNMSFPERQTLLNLPDRAPSNLLKRLDDAGLSAFQEYRTQKANIRSLSEKGKSASLVYNRLNRN